MNKYPTSPVLINCGADISSLVTPHVPARPASKLGGKAVLHTNRKLVLIVLFARILRYIQLYMLRH